MAEPYENRVYVDVPGVVLCLKSTLKGLEALSVMQGRHITTLCGDLLTEALRRHSSDIAAFEMGIAYQKAKTEEREPQPGEHEEETE